MQSYTTYGSVIAKLKGDKGNMPPYVHLGGKLFNSPGVGSGVMGSAYEPIEIPDPTGTRVQLPQFVLTADVSAERFHQRRALLTSIDKVRAEAQNSPAVERMGASHRRAVQMLTSPRVRDAFDLSKEKEAMHVRYGANFFGKSLLMARRLIEAGTRFVQVKWYDWDGGWDIHGFNSTGIERMEEELCPRFDQGMSALLDDLQDRGLLESTLIVAVGEMGRTPKINKWGGRDHWGERFRAPRRRPACRAARSSADGCQCRFSGRGCGPAEAGSDHLSLAGINTNLDPHPPLHQTAP